MPTQETLQFDSDGFRLTGTLHLPDTPLPRVVIGCHGLLADRQSPKQIALGQALNEIGIAYLRFDHRGCGDSQGQLHAATLLSTRCRDLYHAMRRMQSQTHIGPLLGFFGSSFGGTVAMATAAEHPVQTIISYAAPLYSRSIHNRVLQDIRAHQTLQAPEDTELFFDIQQQVQDLDNILILHGEMDEIVPVSHAHRIHQLSKEPKKLILFPKGDHRMSDSAHQSQFIQICKDWYDACGAAGTEGNS